MSNEYKNIQSAIDSLLNIKSVVRRKKKTEHNRKKEIFVQVINGIEEAIIRSNIAFMDFGLDYSKYDEAYLAIIDALIYMNFGKEATELISFYLWDRTNSDGSINPITDQDGAEILLKNPYELWDLLSKLDPKM